MRLTTSSILPLLQGMLNSSNQHQAVICFADAGVSPDAALRDAGLGIFLIFTGQESSGSLHIKVKTRASSVLMAELAALLMAAKGIKNLQIKNAVIATTSCIAGRYLLEVKIIFKQTQEGSWFQVVKIDRKLDPAAHHLALQAKSGVLLTSSLYIVLDLYNIKEVIIKRQNSHFGPSTLL